MESLSRVELYQHYAKPPEKKKLNDVVLKIGNLNFFVSNNYALNNR